MKNNRTQGYMILILVFILISIIALVVPTSKTGTVWIAYAFTIVAFAAQTLIWKAALGKEKTLKSAFLGFPVIHIGIVYLIIQIAVFAIFVIVPTLPIWSVVAVCTVIFCISAVCIIATNPARNEIDRVEARVEKKTFYIKKLQSDIELLADNEHDVSVKSALTQLAEKIRFSDPMSNGVLTDLENKISAKVIELNTTTNKMEIICEINFLIDERNKQCKLFK